MPYSSHESVARLARAADYRAFILAALELRSQRGRKFGYSDIARAAGFSSRSFVRDVVVGKKGLTSESARKIAAGLRLTPDLSALFLLLVDFESDAKKNKPRLERLRNRLLQPSLKEHRKHNDSFSDPLIPFIYAALGTAARGASLAEISKRTDLKTAALEKPLAQMIALGITRTEGGRYFATNDHLSLQNFVTNEAFQKFFLHQTAQATEHARKGMARKDQLFFSSSFSVRKSQLPALKEELRSLLLKYVDSSEEAEGDRIASVICSLF